MIRAVVVAALLLVPAMARAADVTVDAAWARATAGAGTTGAVYVTLTGHGSSARLTGARTPAADMAMLHEDRKTDGVMRMRDVAGVDVPATGSVTLRPGGTHIMLEMLHAPLRQGDRMPLTLLFADGHELEAVAKVGPVGAMAPPAR